MMKFAVTVATALLAGCSGTQLDPAASTSSAAAAATLSVGQFATPNEPPVDLTALRGARIPTSRQSFLGFVGHRAVYRSLVCASDSGRGDWCDLTECVASPRDPGSAAAMWFDSPDTCTVLASREFSTGSISAYNERTVTALPYDRGVGLAADLVKATAAAGRIELVRRVDAGTSLTVAVRYDTSSDPAHPQSAERIHIKSVARTADDTCIFVLGDFSLDGYYEGVPYTQPVVLANLLCESDDSGSR